MRYVRTMLILGILVPLAFGSLHAAGPQTRGIQITPKSAPRLENLYSRSHAVIIGINGYAKLPPLDYAVRDARAMEEKLKSLGFKTNLLLDQQATRANILQTLEEQLSRKTQQADRVVIFFAGRTQTERSGDGTEAGYLVPFDADSGDISRTSISVSQIRDMSQRLQAHHVLYLIDSCLGGLGLTASETILPGDRNYLQKIASRKAHHMVTAGRTGETIHQRQEGLSAFAFYTLEALDGSADRGGKGFVTFDDLASHVKLQVSRFTTGKQVPQYGNIVGKGEIVFLLTERPASVRAETTAPLPDSQKTLEEKKLPEADATSPAAKPAQREASPSRPDHDHQPMVEDKKLPVAEGMTLAAKQAQMEELKRQDKEPVKPTRVALVQPSMSAAREAGRDGRFIAYENGTVLDTRTNLMWAAKDNGSNINWQNAKSYCENYRGGGYTDWRMPTQDELAGLYDKTVTNTNPAAAGCGGGYHLTDLIHLTCCCPWAAETRGSQAAYFGFNNGPRKWLDQAYTGGIRVIPVRSGK